MQVISPDDQILKHFATNDKILTQRNTNLISRNIANLKEKYKSISIEILRPERADLVDKCPAFDFFLKRLDVFMHTLYSKFRYMITISSLYPKMTSFINRLGFREGALCSHQLAREDMS